MHEIYYVSGSSGKETLDEGGISAIREPKSAISHSSLAGHRPSCRCGCHFRLRQYQRPGCLPCHPGQVFSCSFSERLVLGYYSMGTAAASHYALHSRRHGIGHRRGCNAGHSKKSPGQSLHPGHLLCRKLWGGSGHCLGSRTRGRRVADHRQCLHLHIACLYDRLWSGQIQGHYLRNHDPGGHSHNVPLSGHDLISAILGPIGAGGRGGLLDDGLFGALLLGEGGNSLFYNHSMLPLPLAQVLGY